MMVGFRCTGLVLVKDSLLQGNCSDGGWSMGEASGAGLAWYPWVAWCYARVCAYLPLLCMELRGVRIRYQGG